MTFHLLPHRTAAPHAPSPPQPAHEFSSPGVGDGPAGLFPVLGVQQVGHVRGALPGEAVQVSRCSLLGLDAHKGRPHHPRQDKTVQGENLEKYSDLFKSEPNAFLDLRAGEETEAVQILPRHHVDQHHVPGQQHGAGDALPVPSQLGRLPGEEASLPDGLWPWLPVQLCLLPTDGEFLFG